MHMVSMTNTGLRKGNNLIEKDFIEIGTDKYNRQYTVHLNTGLR